MRRMRDGVCSRCGAATVQAARNGVNFGENSAWVDFQIHRDPADRGIFRVHRGEVWSFLCTSCGALEFAVFDPATIAFTQQSWMHVTPKPPAPPPPNP